jgi:peptidylprolyl isomerase
MVKNFIPILIVIVVLIIGGVGTYFIMNQKNPNIKSITSDPNVFRPVTQTPDQTVVASTSTPSPVPSIVQTQTLEDGLKIEDIKLGDGKEVKSGDSIAINYIGTLPDGTKFDSSYDRGIPFQTVIGVGRVIKGWDEGVVGMKVGGRRRLTIPGDLAYGENGIQARDAQGNVIKDKYVIPPNSILIFDVELVYVK